MENETPYFCPNCVAGTGYILTCEEHTEPPEWTCEMFGYWREELAKYRREGRMAELQRAKVLLKQEPGDA